MSTLRSVIDERKVEDLGALSYTELRDDVVEMVRAIDQLTAQVQRHTREIALRGDHQREGFVSVARWLAVTADIDNATARRHVTAGRVLAEHPDTRERFVAGDLSGWRTRLLVRAAGRHPALYARDEQLLLEQAEGLSHRDFPRAVRYWETCAADVENTTTTGGDLDRSFLHASTLSDGMVKLDGLLDQVTGERFLTAIDTATPAPVTTDTGDTPPPASRRRVEALGHICDQWLQHQPITKAGTRPQVSLIVDLDTLTGRGGRRCDLGWTGPVAASTALELLCDASVCRILTKGPSMPLDVGRASRTVTAAQRRALVIRDGGCAFPGCDRPPAWCDAHHIIHWIDGGSTDLGNLVLLCRRHHTIIHTGHWKITIEQNRTHFARIDTGPDP